MTSLQFDLERLHSASLAYTSAADSARSAVGILTNAQFSGAAFGRTPASGAILNAVIGARDAHLGAARVNAEIFDYAGGRLSAAGQLGTGLIATTTQLSDI